MTRPDFAKPPIFDCAKGQATLLVGEREYKGARFLDIRDWVGDGTKATGKGATIPLAHVPAFAAAVAAYAASLPDNGADTE